jgi:hypothetical protein
MKSNLQIGLGLVILTALVLGGAYMTQWTVPTKIPVPKRPDEPSELRRDATLKFHTDVADWKPDLFPVTTEDDREKFLRMVEVGIKNHYVFWVRNPQPKPVDVVLKATSCTCTDVEYAVFPADAWADWQRQQVLSAVAQGWTGAPVVNPGATAALLQAVTWRKLPGFQTAPPYPQLHPAADGAPPGMIRVNFQPKQLSTQQSGDTISVSLLGRAPGGIEDEKRLTVKYLVVPGLGFFPPSLDAEEIGAGGKKVLGLTIWSWTRETFDPLIKVTGVNVDENGDPCVEIGKPVSVPPGQVELMLKDVADKFKAMKPISACRVEITVHEHRDGHQLDMGPVHRVLSLTVPGAAEHFRVPLSGLVRGEVRVFGGDDRDRIVLGSFNHGAKKSVALFTNRPDLDIELDDATSTVLKCILSKPEPSGDGKKWQLTVEVPDDSTAGELVPGTAVVINVKGAAKPRKLRIPVTGTAAR